MSILNSGRPPYISITLLSGCALAYEVLLMRLFSIIQWHHFAYMVIGLALLGYGMSGTLVSIFQNKLSDKYTKLYLACITLFGISSVVCFLLAQHIPFNAEEILWNSEQVLFLAYIFLLLTIPFFFAATAICLSFMRYPMLTSSIYAVDLLGAGLGSLTVIILLSLAFPQWVLVIIGIISIIDVMIAGLELDIKPRYRFNIPAIVVIGILVLAGSHVELKMSPYKGLSQSLRITGTEITEELSSPLGILSVVASRDVPLRHVPGMSLNANQEPLNQLGIFTDGDNISVMTEYPADLNRLGYMDQITSALPYHLKKLNHVLILGTGGGADVLQAKFHQISNISAIEINPQIVDLVNESYGDFTGHLYQRDDVTIHIGEARDYLVKSSESYDLIQLALFDAFNASISGLYSLNESYLYTTEALRIYLQHLNPDGYVSVTRWIKLPPRDTLKLFATATTVLRQMGVTSPEKSLILIRSWQTSTLLIKNGMFTNEELAAVETFCHERSFDLAYTPLLRPDQANRYNVLSSPLFFQATSAILSENAESFLDRYKFNLQPATDNKPFFHHFFKWSAFTEIYQLRRQGGMPLIEWGYINLIVTLLVASLLSIALIVLPVWYFHRHMLGSSDNIKGTKVVSYFFTIGLAYLFIEIAFIQKFTQLLHHPIYSIAVTLTAFLIFSGVGSLLTARLLRYFTSEQIIISVATGISALCLIYLLSLGAVFTYLTAAPVGFKALLISLLIAPLAILMGMPFPLALASLAKHANYYVPWAWGINGCASVISVVLATILAIHLGFSVVILIAVLLYITIVITFPKPTFSY